MLTVGASRRNISLSILTATGGEAAVRSGLESERLLREKSPGGRLNGNEEEGQEEEALGKRG
jgi:hypothetical protein